MDIKLVNKGETGEVRLIGRLDSTAAPEAGEILNEIADRFEKMVLDLAELEYTASSGLRIIRGIQIKMNKKGGELVLKNTRPMVMEVFEMTGFASFLKFE